MVASSSEPDARVMRRPKRHLKPSGSMIVAVIALADPGVSGNPAIEAPTDAGFFLMVP